MNINGKDKRASCSFQKYYDKPLLMVCFLENDGTNWLKEITKEKPYTNLNIKYNFIIKPVNNEERINLNKNADGSIIYWLYPEVLDFTKSDTLTIEYGLKEPSSLVGISFNDKAKDLNCQTFGREVKDVLCLRIILMG